MTREAHDTHSPRRTPSDRIERCRLDASERFSALLAFDDGMTLLGWIGRTRPATIDLEDAADVLGTPDLVRAFWATVVLSETVHPVLDRRTTVVSHAGSADDDLTRIRMDFDVVLDDGGRRAA